MDNFSYPYAYKKITNAVGQTTFGLFCDKHVLVHIAFVFELKEKSCL